MWPLVRLESPSFAGVRYIVVFLSRVTTTWSPRTKMPGPLHLTIQARIRTSPGCAMSSSVRTAAHRRRRVASGSFPARTSPAGIGTLTKIGSFSRVRLAPQVGPYHFRKSRGQYNPWSFSIAHRTSQTFSYFFLASHYYS